MDVNKDGNLDLQRFHDIITDKTALVSIMWANNETGVIFPIQEIASMCARRNIYLHVDAAQSAGKIYTPMHDGISSMSISGHKFHALKGVGALYIKTNIDGALLYGGEQERNVRAGTENIIGIASMGIAAKSAIADLSDNTSLLRDYFENELIKITNIHINGKMTKRLPNTSNITFYGIDANWILTQLDANGIYVSKGSACSSTSPKPSHVLEAMGLTLHNINSTIRFSMSEYTTKEEIDYTLSILKNIII